MERLSDHKLRLGVCYYPEHWPETLWAEDLRRMKEYGIEYVRIAEFAWCLFEPTEGRYCFDLFDRFLSLAAQWDMKVIFCTPTATPPAWLTETYPETLNASVDGTLYRHGLRRHYNYNAPKYRELTQKIVAQLGRHYGAHPQIIGWQIDNELNCELNEFYSEADHAAFREYLQEKFHTLDDLNEKMGCVVWSQCYSDWPQVHLRRPTSNGSGNPHLRLEEKRFFSWSTVRYFRLQTDVLRPLIGDRFITTNGIFAHVDYAALLQAGLEFICFDSYPNFAFDLSHTRGCENRLRDREWGYSLSRVRDISPGFGIMEQQSGANGWVDRMEAPMPRPGQMRLWTFQSVAHGADAVSYFRWRTAPVGTEIYWHGLLDYDNAQNRRMEELASVRDAFALLRGVQGSRYIARVGIVRDYANDWDAGVDTCHGRLREISEKGLFAACQFTHTPVDSVNLNEDTTLERLARYDVLFYPHATLLEKPAAELLRAYAAQGGQLLFGARSGYKDQYGRCPMRPLAGFAGELAGARVKDYSFVGPYDDPGEALLEGEPLDAPLFNDVLEPCAPDARVDAVYSANYYAGEPAMISRPIGSGRAYYFGAAFSEAAATRLLRMLGCAEPFASLLDVPEACELALRRSDTTDYYFVLNYSAKPQKVVVRRELTDCLAGSSVAGDISLPAYGVLILSDERRTRANGEAPRG